MRHYKVTENPKGVFKIYKQNWFGYWRVYGKDDVRGWTDTEYDSFDDAQQSLVNHMRKDKEKEAFKPRTWYFGGL